MTWGGYKAETSKVAELDLTKPPSDEPVEDPAEKAAAEAEHWANVEADELDRLRMLNSTPSFTVVKYPVGEFLCLPDDGDKKGEMIPRAHLEKIDFVRRDGNPLAVVGPSLHRYEENNDYEVGMARIYERPIPPVTRRMTFIVGKAGRTRINIVMSSGRSITFECSRHYPEITLAAMREAWMGKSSGK
jgi:hypothetical protein